MRVPRKPVPSGNISATRRLAMTPLATPAAESTADLLARRAEKYRRKSAVVAVDDTEFVVFLRAGLRYALEIRQLLEIRALGRFATVPGVSQVIKGIIQVRGQVVAIHDLASFAHDAALDKQSFAVVGAGEAATVALLADEVEGVASYASDRIHRPPVNLGWPEDCFTGVTHDGALVLNLGGLMLQPAFFQA